MIRELYNIKLIKMYENNRLYKMDLILSILLILIRDIYMNLIQHTR